jgi:hypothetical protein
MLMERLSFEPADARDEAAAVIAGLGTPSVVRCKRDAQPMPTNDSTAITMTTAPTSQMMLFMSESL